MSSGADLPYAYFITDIAAMIVVPCPLTWHSALVATIGATPIKTPTKKGIVAGHHDEVLSTTSMDVVLLCGLRRNALV